MEENRMAKTLATTVPDGRRLRSDRSKKAIIDAMMDMISEGNLMPTAQQVSERAGVGIRSVFRHFEDMENLFSLCDDARRQSYEEIFLSGNREGTLSERIVHAAEQHAKGYELHGNITRMTLAQRWRYKILRQNYARYQRGLRKDLENWLPEITHLDTTTREAIDAVASFEFWNRLREDQGLSKNSAINVVVEVLKGLIIKS